MQLPVPGRVPLHAAPAAGPDLAFTALLALAGVGSAVVLGLALAALVRRRSRSYLLVTLALATLLARTGVAALSFAGSMDAALHHWLEHGLDAVMAALVVAAVYDARAVRQSSGGSGSGGRGGGGESWSRGDGDGDRSVRSDGGADPTRPGAARTGSGKSGDVGDPADDESHEGPMDDRRRDEP